MPVSNCWNFLNWTMACVIFLFHFQGDKLSGEDTSCRISYCSKDFRVENNVCVQCDSGTTNQRGDDARGADTLCDEPCKC